MSSTADTSVMEAARRIVEAERIALAEFRKSGHPHTNEFIDADNKLEAILRDNGADVARALIRMQEHPVFAFLLGEAPLDGRWFGDKSPVSRGGRPMPYWWRSHLRAALSDERSVGEKI